MSAGSPGSKWLGRLAVAMAALTCVSIALLHAVSYADGRRGTISLLLSIGVALVALGSTAALFVLVVVALVRRRQRRLVIGCLALALLVFLANGLVPPVELFRIGFRHRLQATITPEQLRQIAIKCSELMPQEGQLPGPGKNLWVEAEHAATWAALTNATAIGKLDPSLCIYNHTDEIEILWGGALAGHWGVVIAKKPGLAEGDIAPGIRTVYGSH
jgi:hypothetical protein